MNISRKQLTPSELSYADGVVFTEKQLQFLFQKTPAKYCRTKPGKGGSGNLTYVSVGYIQKVLNLLFGFRWNFELIGEGVDLDSGQIWVRGRLTVPDANGNLIIKENFGAAEIKYSRTVKTISGNPKPLSVGNDLKAAASDCLKKCASMLGIAADIYSGEEFTEIQVVEEKLPDRTRQLFKYLEQTHTTEEMDMVKDDFLNTYGEFTDREARVFNEMYAQFANT